MRPDLEKLIVLQRHDLEGKRVREALAALPKRLAELAAKFEALKGQRAVVLGLLQKEELLRRQQESEVKDKQAKIAKVRKQLDQATSTVQVTAFEHEIGFAEAEISRLEDAELESMERTEGLEAQKRLADEAVARRRR
jgi:predicted  nucleic acid-binding Zn-ribbon protein